MRCLRHCFSYRTYLIQPYPHFFAFFAAPFEALVVQICGRRTVVLINFDGVNVGQIFAYLEDFGEAVHKSFNQFWIEVQATFSLK